MSRLLPGTARAMNLYPDYFAFVRDPYQRFVSLWLDLRRVARLHARPLDFVGSVGLLDEDFRRLANLLCLPGGDARGAPAGAASRPRLSAGRAGMAGRCPDTDR